MRLSSNSSSEKEGENLSNEKNTILVTGATGNIGRQLLDQLLGPGAPARTFRRWAMDHSDDFRQRRRQRQWVDTVFEALEPETVPDPGGVSAHFHLSIDGTRVLNYAEWIDEEAHREAIENSHGGIGPGPKWQRVRSFPGLKSGGFKRYRVARSLASQPAIKRSA
jgi:Antibiotic biosynthesis monooxygenase